MLRLRPLLTAMHRYDKSLSTRNRGRGTTITAPVLAYLLETINGRILFDVGCDYRKLADAKLRAQYYDPKAFPQGAPEMTEEQTLGKQLAAAGLSPKDVDAVICSHLHFDHAGGLHEFEHADVYVHELELAAARIPADSAYFPSDFTGRYRWRRVTGDEVLVAGLTLLASPGHTAGHMSLMVDLEKQAPVLLAGDAADLQENLDQEIAPGVLWRDEENLAITSIRRLKKIAREAKAELWPNHDLAFWQARKDRTFE